MITIKAEVPAQTPGGPPLSPSYKYDDIIKVAIACRAAGQDARSGHNVVYRVEGVPKPSAKFFQKLDNHIKYGGK